LSIWLSLVVRVVAVVLEELAAPVVLELEQACR
jgi:hypothetical protein